MFSIDTSWIKSWETSRKVQLQRAVQSLRKTQGQGPHLAGNPPLHDLTIAENGESNEGFME